MFQFEPAEFDEKESAEWEWLRHEIYTRALSLNNKIIFDFREMLTGAKVAEIAGRLMWRLIKQYSPSVIVGPGFGATPLLYATALAALDDGVELAVLMVRDKRKDHNRKRWIEGKKQAPGTRAVIIDDFMSKGTARVLVEQALAADGHKLDIAAFALFFDMWEPLGSRQISLRKFPVVSLFKRHHIGLSRDCFDAVPPQMTGAHPPFLLERKWWKFNLHNRKGGLIKIKSAPVIHGDAVFVADDESRVWRHNAETGDIEWQYESATRPEKGIVQLLQYVDDSLVFGCYDGSLTRLDARDGRIMWRWRLDTYIHATPVIDLPNRRLFINTEQEGEGRAPYGHLYACDLDSGRVLWKTQHAYWPPGSPVYCPDHNIVVATCNDLSVIGVDADDGSVRWRGKSHGLVRGRPVMHAGNVYCATETGRLHCFNLADGEQRWCVCTGKGPFHAFLTVADGNVILFDGQCHLFAFDAVTGELAWASRLRGRGVWCPVQYGPYLVALSTGGEVAVIDTRTRLKVWEAYRDYLRGEFQQPPAVGAGLLAAASNTSGLQAFTIHPFYTEQAS